MSEERDRSRSRDREENEPEYDKRDNRENESSADPASEEPVTNDAGTNVHVSNLSFQVLYVYNFFSRLEAPNSYY